MDYSILEDLGLTRAEIKVYIALLELGTSKAGPIIFKTGLQNSVVHMTLKKLLEKGLITFIKKSKVKHYTATDPKNILRWMDEKKEKFSNILPILEAKKKPTEPNEAEVFLGFKGFKTLMYNMIEDTKPGDEYLFFTFSVENPDEYEFIFNFYREFDKERERLGLNVKGILTNDLKKFMKNRPYPEVLFVDFPIPVNTSIVNNKVCFSCFEEENVSFLIRSRQLAESQRKMFYQIWNRYKK